MTDTGFDATSGTSPAFQWMDSENLLDRFARTFEGNPDELDGFTVEKVYDRAVHVDTQDNKAIFEIERHQAILGVTYVRGMGMASYITYWPRFAFDVTTRIRTALPEMRGREVEIDYDSLADCWFSELISFHSSRQDDGRIEIDESVGGDTAILDNPEEIRGFVESIADSWGIEERLSNELSDDLSNEEIERHAVQLCRRLIEELERMALGAWKECAR